MHSTTLLTIQAIQDIQAIQASTVTTIDKDELKTGTKRDPTPAKITLENKNKWARVC